MSIKIYSVSEISKVIKDILESNFYGIWVEGEISSMRYSSTGHLYFSLIDDDASLGVIIYKNRIKNMRFNIKNGLKVVVFGSLSLYLKGGEYRIVAEHMRISGSGKKFFDLEKLKKEFKAKGYFDRKRPIPVYPKDVIVVTSPTGAAIQDIVNILKRRGFGMNVYIYPVSVQGDAAKASIIKALSDINKLDKSDLVILARGGGSNEDLWIFNDPDIAKKLFDVKFPTISAIGHEIDFTLCDFVADLRAETPSAAAELITKSRVEIIENINRLNRMLIVGIKRVLDKNRRKLDLFSKKRYKLRIDGFINSQTMYLDNTEQKIRSKTINLLNINRSILQKNINRIEKNSPLNRLKSIEHKVDFLKYKIDKSIKSIIDNRKRNLDFYNYKLRMSNPENILQKGYTITLNDKGIPIKSAHSAKQEKNLITRFRDGSVKSVVEE